MLVIAILLNLAFALLSCLSLLVGGFIYLKTGSVPLVHEALSFFELNANALYSSTFVGYNKIIHSFLETNVIYGSFELLFISLGITWMADLFE